MRHSLRIAVFAILWPSLATAIETNAPPSPAPAPVKPAASAPASVTDADDNPQTSNTAILQGLNKVTGHISRLEGPVGATQRFGNLEIIPRRCWKSAPEDRPENAVLLEIRELKTGEESRRIFLGWMFSSSPGLSGLEHPVYDITVLSCEYRPDPEKPASAQPTAASSPAEAGGKAAKKAARLKKKPATPAATTAPATAATAPASRAASSPAAVSPARVTPATLVPVTPSVPAPVPAAPATPTN